MRDGIFNTMSVVVYSCNKVGQLELIRHIFVIFPAAGEAEHDGAEDGAVSPQPGKNH